MHHGLRHGRIEARTDLTHDTVQSIARSRLTHPLDAMITEQAIKLSRHDGGATVSLNRSQRKNAMTGQGACLPIGDIQRGAVGHGAGAAMSAPAPRLRQVHCAAPQPGALAPVFRALGVAPLDSAADELRLPCGGQAVVSFAPHPQALAGVWGVSLEVPDLPARQAALAAAGIAMQPLPAQAGLGPGCCVAAADAGGVQVMLRSAPARALAAPAPSPAAEAAQPWHLDHVALLVRDEAAAARTWQAITGVRAHPLGVHPVSAGTFTATRLLLGAQMIELIAVVPGHDTALARRLAARGEGAVTLALPVADLAAAQAGLAAAGITPLRADPHVMLHPKDTGGVMIQLTPRVQH